MAPLIFFCAVVGTGFTYVIARLFHEGHLQKRAARFAKVYNQAAYAQWERFREAYPDIRCAPPIGRSGSMVWSILGRASGTSDKLWRQNWDKSAESSVLATFYDDATYFARELKNEQARKAKRTASRKDIHITVTFAAA